MNDPGYLHGMDAEGSRAMAAARQILETTRRFRNVDDDSLDVLDVGSGYGHTAAALASLCRSVVAIEPSDVLHNAAVAANAHLSNVQFRHCGIESVFERDRYDLVVLDNVFEHLPDQSGALTRIATALRPGGVLYLLVPNRLWPIEHHYHLPFLSYLPLRLANAYLRASGRGDDYTDASYAPTYGGLNRLLAAQPFDYQYVLPADLSLAECGSSWHYRLGAAMIGRFPALWRISKALLVVAVRKSDRESANTRGA